MQDAITALLNGRPSIGVEAWRSLWDQIDRDALPSGQCVALLASVTTQLPDHSSLVTMLASLAERRPPVTARWPGSVNIVGTGGGPQTFNVSTAAAFVAAAMGVPVVKTGSRAYTSKYGSIDLLERLGVRLTESYEQTGEALDQFGIAFAGYFVYPASLTKMARAIMPLTMRSFGRYLNAVGPFLAAVPVTAQVTGVSVQAPLDRLRRLATTVHSRQIWLVSNDLGADELLSFASNTIHRPDGVSHPLPAGTIGSAAGSLADLRPVDGSAEMLAHFLDVLGGKASDVASETVCLNAAALAVASGRFAHWRDAMASAREALRDGAARALVDRMRAARRGALATAGGS